MSQVKHIRMVMLVGDGADDATKAVNLQADYETFRDGAGEAVWITVIQVADFAIAIFYME